MPLGFSLHTSCTRFTIFLDKITESRPGIIVADEVHCLILTGMSREDVVMLVVENSELEVIGIGDVYETIMEKSVGSDRPAELQFFEVGNVKRVIGKCGKDI